MNNAGLNKISDVFSKLAFVVVLADVAGAAQR